MPHDLEYVVTGAIMKCTDGSAPMPFTGTYNQKVKIGGIKATTAMDKVAFTNIPVFGICRILTGKSPVPCSPAPTQWDKTYEAKVLNQETLVYKSCMNCAVGGKISFVTSGQIPLPPDELSKLSSLHGASQKTKEWYQFWISSNKPKAPDLTGSAGDNFAKDAAAKVDEIAQAQGKVPVYACFPAGTPVYTREGMVPIERIEIGDWVYSWHEASGETRLRQVISTQKHQVDALIELDLGEEKIKATPEHPFYVKGKWITAGRLKEGDALSTLSQAQPEPILATASGPSLLSAPTFAPIVKPLIKKNLLLNRKWTVYNIEVEGEHNYFVGQQKVLVHNATCVKTMEVVDAYFANRKVEAIYSGTNTTYTVVAGDYLSKIAKKQGTTVADLKTNNGLTSDVIQIGQKLTISKQTKTGEKVSFEKIKNSHLGKEVYLMVKTLNAQGSSLDISLYQGKAECLEKVDKPITVQLNGADKTKISAIVGQFTKHEGVPDPKLFANFAIKKVKLIPKDKKKAEAYGKAIKKIKDQKTFLYVRVDAQAKADHIVNYHGYNQKEEKGPGSNKPYNLFLRKDTSYFEIADCCARKVTKAQLKKIFTSATDAKLEALRDNFNDAFEKFEINTCKRKAHFFAQIREEVGASITTLAENMNYSETALIATFSYFRRNPTEANTYGRTATHAADQQAIANRAYANRLGNGNIASGDGWDFRGKGYIQLTGRSNYNTINTEIQSKYPTSNIDIIARPGDILTDKGALISAMAYWTHNGLNALSDNGATDADVDSITGVINLHTSSYAKRRAHFNNTKVIFEVDQCKLP